ncbi:MAG: phage tail protein [Goleter apudmare HA4340-LM2]|jgi:phage tail-like protein|nr:phage tail protein [Goleter apudmare HA4340-LM2]
MARVDPYKNYRFKVEIQGIIEAGFAECSGFGSEVQVVEYREGGDVTTARKLPGMAKFPDITLKWGVTDSLKLYNWHLDAVNGNVQRQNGSIVILDEADPSQEKARWNFINAWASKYVGPSFNAKGNDVAIDTFTIVCERLERVK